MLHIISQTLLKSSILFFSNLFGAGMLCPAPCLEPDKHKPRPVPISSGFGFSRRVWVFLCHPYFWIYNWNRLTASIISYTNFHHESLETCIMHNLHQVYHCYRTCCCVGYQRDPQILGYPSTDYPRRPRQNHTRYKSTRYGCITHQRHGRLARHHSTNIESF